MKQIPAFKISSILLNRLATLSATAACCLVAGMVFPSISCGQDAIDFNREIRPILSDRCYQCHGPDASIREADLRFDIPEEAVAELPSGGHAIVPGDVDASLMIDRITSDDDSLIMPPRESNKSLTENEIELIKKWIEQGAPFDGHWAFTAPKRPDVPDVDESVRVANEIDNFIVTRAKRAGLEQSPRAEREKLIRRVTLDLTGLPPTIEEVEAFLNDESEDAYAKLVDRLLESPRYGEQMARYWLDAARYGDTHGLHLDNKRQMWPYRDWVINAFNSNMPFDQFTVEQLAGDLLPSPTTDQLVATGFNRCNVTTSEGGSIAEEYRVRYAVDRVETTSTVFLGLTAGCAVCHDHKFDPLSQREFYQMYAYFYNFAENEMDGNAELPPPVVAISTEGSEAIAKQLEQKIATLQKQVQDELGKLDLAAIANVEETSEATGPFEFVWIEDRELPAGANAQGNSPWEFVDKENGPVFEGNVSTVRVAEGLSQHFFDKATAPLRIGKDDVLFAYVYLDPENPPQEIMLQFNDGSWDHRAYWGENRIEWGGDGSPSRLHLGPLPEAGKWIRLEVPAEKVNLKPGAALNGWAFTQFGGKVYWDHAGSVTSTPQDGSQFASQSSWESFARSTDVSLPKPLKEILDQPSEERTDEQQLKLTRYFAENVFADTREVFDPLHEQLAGARAELKSVRDARPKTLVMGDRPRDNWKPVYLLNRGQYDQPVKDEALSPGTPECLPEAPEETPDNRLGLAKWITDPNHPLTARVTVNRYWQHLFGTGIVKTSEDFGSQGEFPSHPELLDWLAVEFIESGWDVKHIHRLIVMSETYRQTTKLQPIHLEKDPANRLLARGPRFRMDAEMIRDNALAIAGLLGDEIGGPSVRPYQPLGLWKAVGYTSSNTANFKQDHGEALYRRSMYTFWKRTSPPPTMQIFDAPSREVCTVRRERTNTPAAALAVMNDVQFVEAARYFAQRLLQDKELSDGERLSQAFETATARKPSANELAALERLLEKMRSRYAEDAEAATKLIAIGEAPLNEELDPNELAAWTMVASTILNLDEVLTKG